MNNAKVAEWLREAANLAFFDAPTRFSGEAAEKKWIERASKVEAMTCDTCQHWHHIEAGDGECNSPKNSSGNYGFEDEWMMIDICGPKFGCIHWEQKP